MADRTSRSNNSFGEENTDLTPRIVHARRRANMVWLVGGIAAFALAGGITVMAKTGNQALDRASSVGLETEAVRIVGAIETSARAARLQVDGYAASPMLRNAISTDEKTIVDVATNELRFTPKSGETLEIYQVRGTGVVSLLRLPASASAINPISGRATRLENYGKGSLDIVAGAPIEPQDATAASSGQIALSLPIELGGARQRLFEIVVEATLVGAGPPVVLVANTTKRTSPYVDIAVHPNPEWGIPKLTLRVIPKDTTMRASWIDPVRYGGLGVGVLLLLLFLIGMRRR